MSFSAHLAGAAVLAISIGAPLAFAAGRPAQQSGAYVSSIQATSKSAAKDFAPDGNLEKAVWRKATRIKMERDAFSPAAYPQAATEVASVWTAENVYFAFRCKYTDLNLFEGKDAGKDFWTLWDRDVVEVFLNPQPERLNHYYEYEVAPNNLWIDLAIDLDKKPMNDPHWDSHYQHATHVDARNHVWTCEMRIPVRSMGSKPLQAGDAWRINIFRADGLGDDAHRRFLSWSPVKSERHSFHAPASFGVLRFEK